MDKTDAIFPFYALWGHPECYHWVLCVKRRSDAPADYFLREGIKDKRQVAEVVAGIAVHDDNVRYITHPELVRRRRNKVLNDVRIRR